MSPRYLTILTGSNLTDDLLGPFAGAFSADLRAAYLATENYLAGFGAHGRTLQRALSRPSMPLGLEARNGRAAHSYGQRPGNDSSGFGLNLRGVGLGNAHVRSIPLDSATWQ